MSEQTPLTPHPESGAPFVSLVTGPVGPTEKAPPRVVWGMALAQFGLFVALLAPVTVSLAIKMTALFPEDLQAAAAANGEVQAIAAFVALAANPIVGRLSDYTTSRFGRRRPWMFGGAIGFVIALAIVAIASSVPVVLIGWMLAQLFGNIILAPLLTTIADQVPESQRGRVSANVGIMQNLGILAAAYVAAWFVGNMFLLFVLPAAFAAAVVILYCFLLPDKVITEKPKEDGGLRLLLMTFWVNPVKYPDFAWVWISRFLLYLSNFLFIVYRLFFLKVEVHLSTEDAVGIFTTGVLINTVTLVVFAWIGGWLSDRTSNRKAFVIAATVLFAIGIGLLSATSTVPMFYLVEILMGAGMGVYTAADTALVVDVLPNPDDSAKDLGVLNIANALPQSLAGLVGTMLLGIGNTPDGNYNALFVGAGVLAFLGALTILPVRSTARRHADAEAKAHA